MAKKNGFGVLESERERERDGWGGGLLNLTIVDVVWFLGWLGVVRSLT